MTQFLFMAAVGISWFFSSPPIPTVPFSTDAPFTTSGDRAWKGHNAGNEDLPTFDEIFAAADATEASVRATMLATDRNLSRYRKVDRVIIGASYEGGTAVHAWYDGDVLRKALMGCGRRGASLVEGRGAASRIRSPSPCAVRGRTVRTVH